MVRVIIMVIFTIFINGCVGGGLINEITHSSKHKDGFVLENNSVVENHPEIFGIRPLVTIESLISSIGEPYERITYESGLTVLRYKNGFSWRGIIVFVVVPIPLALPIGQDWIEYHFINGSLAEYRITYGWLQNIATCGLYKEVCSYQPVLKL